ncbi:MAG: T9SS type A sorting domain-containing protein [Ignavibacteriae bacterium]|nr:T9SS type A sorting domain-containing protein [Ignavibacteriota bacterium]
MNLFKLITVFFCIVFLINELQSQSDWKLYKSTYGDLQMNDTLFNIRKIITTKNQVYVATAYGLATIKDDVIGWFNWNNTGLTNKITWNIMDMCIDKDDNIWCATNYGLLKYDGSQFTIYTNANSGLKTNSFTGITFNSNNSIWCTDMGKYIYKMEDTTIQVFDLLALNIPLPYIQGSFIQADKQGNIWYSSGKLLVHYDGVQWIVSDSNFVPLDPTGEVIRKFYITKDNSIVIITSKENVLIFRNGIWYEYSHENITGLPEYEPGKKYIFTIFEDKIGNLLVGVAGVYQKEKPKILVLDKNININNLWSSIDLPPIGTTDSSDPNIYAPSAIAIDDDNKLWVGTNVEGVLLFNQYPTSVVENESNVTQLVFQNPVKNYLTLDSYQEIGDIEIFSALGIKVIETDYKDRIDVSGLSAGVYFVKVGDKIYKFVKF